LIDWLTDYLTVLHQLQMLCSIDRRDDESRTERM